MSGYHYQDQSKRTPSPDDAFDATATVPSATNTTVRGGSRYNNSWGTETSAVSRFGGSQGGNVSSFHQGNMCNTNVTADMDMDSNYHLPSGFQNMTLSDNSNYHHTRRKSSLAQASDGDISSEHNIGKAPRSSQTFSSTASSFSLSPTGSSKKSSLSAAAGPYNPVQPTLSRPPPGFNSSTRSSLQRSNNQYEQSDRYSEADNSSLISRNTYNSNSTFSPRAWNSSHCDDSQYSYISNSTVNTGNGSSLYRYSQNNRFQNPKNDNGNQPGTHRCTELQKMLDTTLAASDTGNKSMQFNSAPKASVFELPPRIATPPELQEDHTTKDKNSEASSFALPPRLPSTTSAETEQEAEASRCSKSTNSMYNTKPKSKEWRMKMMQILKETPVGQLDPSDVPLYLLMTEWSRTKSNESAEKTKEVLDRLEAEINSGNTKFELNAKAYTAAIDAWARTKEDEKAAVRAEEIFKHMLKLTESGNYPGLKISNGVFNATINCLAQKTDKNVPSQCEKYLRDMLEMSSTNSEVRPDSYTWNTVMHAYVQNWVNINSSDVDSATIVKKLLEDMAKEYKAGRSLARPETISYNIVINALAKSKKVGAASDAAVLLAEMHDKFDNGDEAVKPNVVTYCAVIDAYAKTNSSEAAKEGDRLLTQMMKYYNTDPVGNRDLRPNTHVFNTVMNCWSKSKDPEAGSKAEEMFAVMEQLHQQNFADVKPDAFTYTVLIDAWAKTGRRGIADKAEKLLEKMKAEYDGGRGDKDLKPNTYTYNAVLNAMAKSGESDAADRAEKVLKDMVEESKKKGGDIKPATIHFNALLDAVAKSKGGRAAADRAEGILQWMLTLMNEGHVEVRPDTITYNAVLDAWARSGGHVDAAVRAGQILEFMDTLKDKGVQADSYTYNTVINCWAKSGARNGAMQAEKVLSNMKKKYHETRDRTLKPNTRTYTSLIDCWAKSGDPESAVKAKEILDEMQENYNKTRDNTAKPNTHSYNAVMNACAFATAPEKKTEALNIAFNVFEQLRMQGNVSPDAYTYTIMLSVVSNLIPRHDRQTRYTYAEDLFTKCKKSGNVNDFVLRKLNHVVTKEEFLPLVDYRVNSSAKNLPQDWTRNALGGNKGKRGGGARRRGKGRQ